MIGQTAIVASCAVALICICSNAEQEKMKEANSISMPDVLDTGKGFSFTKNGVVAILDNKTGKYKLDVDIMWDSQVALRCNNIKAGPGFSGQALIIDLGKIELDKVKEAPNGKGVRALGLDAIRQGHTYCVSFANGKGNGLIHVLEYDPRNGTLVITWRILPKFAK